MQSMLQTLDDWCSTEHKLRTCDKTSQLRDLQHGVLQPRSTYIASTLRSTRCGQDRRSHLYTALQTFVASLMERPAQGHWQAMQQPAGHDLQVGTLVSRGSKNHHKGQCNPCRNHFTAPWHTLAGLVGTVGRNPAIGTPATLVAFSCSLYNDV
eukprot:s4082_g1.t1